MIELCKRLSLFVLSIPSFTVDPDKLLSTNVIIGKEQ